MKSKIEISDSVSNKVSKWKNVAEKWNKVVALWKEITEWKLKYATQKYFFSLEQYEQEFLEKTYVIVAQMYPDLHWDDFICRLKKIDNYDKWSKSIIKFLKNSA